MKNILILPTEREGLILKELATPADDIAYFNALQENPEHVDNYLNEVASKYDTLKKVTERRLSAGDDIRMGIWHGDDLKGGISGHVSEANKAQVELGYWLKKEAEGHGYATLAVRAMTAYIRPKFHRLYAEVHPENEPSIKTLKRAGYNQIDVVKRVWSGQAVNALVFEPVE